MILDLDETKTWMRVDGPDDDETIQMLISAAETYLKNATGSIYDSTNSLAKLYCLVLVADWYENRDLIGAKPSEKIRLTIQSMTAQLQYCGDFTAPDAPTGLYGIAGDSLVDLAWDVSTEGDLVGYCVYQGGAKITEALVAANSYQVTGLTNDVTYTFQVSAVDKTGNESNLSTAVRAVPTI